MDPLLKQRLVGASVMVGLAVIIIPAWLEQETSAPVPVIQRDMAPMPATELPREPAMLEPVIEEEISSGLEASNAELAKRLPALPAPASTDAAPPNPSVEVAAAVDSAEVQAGASPVTQAPPSQPPPSSVGADQKWLIQLGSFARRENAENLHAKLRKAGFEASVVPLDTNGKVSYRVWVGGNTNHQEAARLHVRLHQELGVSGMLVRGD
jgi:DedD protein